jgi:hypothetical protein
MRLPQRRQQYTQTSIGAFSFEGAGVSLLHSILLLEVADIREI